MVRSNFVPITSIIYEYERIPHSARLQPEKEVVGSNEEMTIHVQDIHDHQGRQSPSWQRVVVEVQEGELLNGARLEDGNRKLYAFEVGTGALQLQYKSPKSCKTKTEKVAIYNSCEWGLHSEPSKLGITSPKQEIGSAEFEIVCAEGDIEFKESFRWPADPRWRCTYEDPSDVVSFRLMPTADPCVFRLEGGTSDPVIRKEYCHEQYPTWFQEHWVEIERQTRVVGGTVDFRDKRIPAFRPWIEHRRSHVRCDHHSVKDHGPERRWAHGCFLSGEQWEPTYLGTRDVSKSFWGMPLQDGYLEDHQLSQNNGFSYTLRIDEKPFQRLEERCRKYMESQETQVPADSSDSGAASPSEVPSGLTSLDTMTEEAASPSFPREKNPPGSRANSESYDQIRAPLSSAESNTGRPRQASSEEVPESVPDFSTGGEPVDDTVKRSIDTIRRALGM